MPEANDVLHRAQQVELPLGERRGLRHGRRHRLVDAQHDPGVLQRQEQPLRRRRPRRGLHELGRHAEEDLGVGLDDRPVEHPRVTRADPADRVRVHAAGEQPDAGVGRGLAGSDDHVLRRSRADVHQLVDRQHVHTVGHAERRRREGRDLRSEVAGVDHAGRAADPVAPAGDARDERVATDVLTGGVERHPSRGEQPLAQHAVVVVADLLGCRALVQARLGSVLLDAAAAEQRRRDAVERGRLVQPDEGVGVQPVPAGTVPAVDERDGDVRVVHEGVDERHPRGSRADHQVVGLLHLGHLLIVR